MQYFLTCSLKLLWKNCKLFSANCKTRYPNLSVYGSYSRRMALTKLTRIFFLVCWRRTIQKKKSNWVSTAVMDARVLFSAESTKPRSAAKCLMWPVLSDWAFFTTTTAWWSAYWIATVWQTRQKRPSTRERKYFLYFLKFLEFKSFQVQGSCSLPLVS